MSASQPSERSLLRARHKRPQAKMADRGHLPMKSPKENSKQGLAFAAPLVRPSDQSRQVGTLLLSYRAIVAPIRACYVRFATVRTVITTGAAQAPASKNGRSWTLADEIAKRE